MSPVFSLLWLHGFSFKRCKLLDGHSHLFFMASVHLYVFCTILRIILLTSNAEAQLLTSRSAFRPNEIWVLGATGLHAKSMVVTHLGHIRKSCGVFSTARFRSRALMCVQCIQSWKISENLVSWQEMQAPMRVIKLGLDETKITPKATFVSAQHLE